MLTALSQRSIGTGNKRDFEIEAKLLHIRNLLLGTSERHDKFYLLHGVSEHLFKKISTWCENVLTKAESVSSNIFFRRHQESGAKVYHRVKDADYLVVCTETDRDLSRIGKGTLCQWAYDGLQFGDTNGNVFHIYMVQPKKIIFISRFDHTKELEEIERSEPAFHARIRDFKFGS